MKTRFAITIATAALGAFAAFAGGGILPVRIQALTNFDKRIDSLNQSPARKVRAASLGSAQEQAIATLRNAIPDVQVSRDTILGTPTFVSATRGFLTGPDGKGKGLSEASLQAVDAADPHRITKAFLNEHSALFG